VRRSAVVVVALLLFGACSSSGTKPQADACQYVTEGDVSTAFGFAVTRDVTLSAQSHQCVFHRSSTNASDSLFLVSVNVAKGQGAVNAYKAIAGDPSVIVLDASGSPAPAPPAHQAVPGLGDGAVWEPDLAQLVVVKGDARLDVMLGGPGNADEAAATHLAAAILPRLT
jgi:hypothetical protein